MEMAWMRQEESCGCETWSRYDPECYGMDGVNHSVNLNHCVPRNGVTFPSWASQPLGIWPLALSRAPTPTFCPSSPIAQDWLKYLTLLKYLVLFHVSLTLYRSQCYLVASWTSNPPLFFEIQPKDIGSSLVFSLNLILMLLGSPSILLMLLL